MKTEIKQQILNSIQWVRENLNYTLVAEDWGNADKKCACAMGCLLLKSNPDDVARLGIGKPNYIEAANLLEVEERWVDSFTEGFDSTGLPQESKVPEAWKLGNEIALETKPINYHEFANQIVENSAKKVSKKKK